jgi:hypothetical protein
MKACGSEILHLVDYPKGANIDAVKFLLKAGADKNVKCKSGMTAMDHAINMLKKGNFTYYDTGRGSYKLDEAETLLLKKSYKDVIELLKRPNFWLHIT